MKCFQVKLFLGATKLYFILAKCFLTNRLYLAWRYFKHNFHSSSCMLEVWLPCNICSDPSLFWLAINSLHCSLTWKHGPCSFAHQSLLAGHLVSRPWFAQVNPTSGSELRLQLPASLILVRAACNVSFNIRCVHLAELVTCMLYWVCERTAVVPMSLWMGISDKIIVKRITIDEAMI